MSAQSLASPADSRAPRALLRALSGLAALALMALPAALAQPSSPQEHVSWWLDSYEPFDPFHPVAVRAQEVFARVESVSALGLQDAHLVLLDAAGEPFAAALPDGTILVTRGGLEICYGDLSRDLESSSTGDDCLAFVLGHEISHLVHRDFWHLDSLLALGDGDGGDSRELLNALRREPDEELRRELRADRGGLESMLLAGYNPYALVVGRIFARWSSRLLAAGFAGSAHPSQELRKLTFDKGIEQLGLSADAFHFGIRLYELGRYDDAELFLEHFRHAFPSREALNALALVHFQKGAALLAACQGQTVSRFWLPTEIDGQTVVSRVRQRGSTRSPCLERPDIHKQLELAAESLGKVLQAEPSYLPALVNLLSVRLLQEREAEAFEVARAATEVRPLDPRSRNGEILAGYRLLASMNVSDAADRTVKDLELAFHDHPDALYLLFNKARIELELGRHASAVASLEKLLQLNVEEPWAGVARELLGRPPKPPQPPRNPPRSPFPLGAPDETGRTFLERQMSRQELRIGSFEGAVYRRKDLAILEMRSAVEIVEELVAREDERPSVDGLIGRHGPPRQRIPAIFGDVSGEILLYPGFALEVRNGRLWARIFFRDAPGASL